MERICLDKINHFVLSKQHLVATTKSDDVVQIVRDVGGLHATISTTPYLSLYARSPCFERTDLDKPLVKLFFLEKIGQDALDEVYASAQRLGKFIADQSPDQRVTRWFP